MVEDESVGLGLTEKREFSPQFCFAPARTCKRTTNQRTSIPQYGQGETCVLYGTEECHETTAFQTLDNNERHEIPDALGKIHQCVRISSDLLRGTQWMF